MYKRQGQRPADHEHAGQVQERQAEPDAVEPGVVRPEDLEDLPGGRGVVAQVLPVPDPAELRTDLERVYRVMQGGMLLTPEERLQPGDEVEILSGSLAGLRGKVLRRGKELRFFVEVHLLQRGVSVEVESWMIRALGRERSGIGDGKN